MINSNACSNICHILHQAIPAHRLKSICLLLHQSRAIKRELCLSGLIQLTGGDNNRKWMWLLTDGESYQYSPGLKYIWQRVRSQHLLLPLCSLSKSKFMKPKFIFTLCFCLLHWGCGACVTQLMLEGSWRGIWKSTQSAIQSEDHKNHRITSAS